MLGPTQRVSTTYVIVILPFYSRNTFPRTKQHGFNGFQVK